MVADWIGSVSGQDLTKWHGIQVYVSLDLLRSELRVLNCSVLIASYVLLSLDLSSACCPL